MDSPGFIMPYGDRFIFQKAPNYTEYEGVGRNGV